MVFPCIICNLEVTSRQQSLECDGCARWQHRTCGTGITQVEYRAACRRGYLDWMCAGCQVDPGAPDVEELEEAVVADVFLPDLQAPGAPDVEELEEAVVADVFLPDLQAPGAPDVEELEEAVVADVFLPDLQAPGAPDVEELEEAVVADVFLPDLQAPGAPDVEELEEAVVADVFLPDLQAPGAPDVEELEEAVVADVFLPDLQAPVNVAPREMYAADLGAYIIPQLLDESELEDQIPSPRPVLQDINEPILYTLVEDSSIRGKDLLIDSYGYRYTLKVDKRRPQVTWRCTARARPFMCKATVHERDGGYVRGLHLHVCNAEPGRDKVAVVCRDAKKEARKRLFDSAAEIVDEVMQDNVPGREIGLCPTMPKIPNMAKQLNHLRRNMRPQEPRTTTFEIEFEHLPNEFLRRDIREGEHRHLLFASDDMIHHLARSKIWYMDATFKVVKAPFMQLFSVHGFIVSGACTKQIPLLFAFMSSRRTEDYNMIFRAILDILPGQIAIRKCVADYEAALWQSVRTVLPNIAQQGCLFHFTQAVYRKLQELGLQRAYVDDEGTHKICRRFMALPLLPAEHIVGAFDELVRMLGGNLNAAIQQMVEYMRLQWVDGRVFKPVDWSVFGEMVRTNNDVEGWHYRLNHRAKKGQLPLYKLVHLLHTEAALTTRTIVLVQREDLTRRQRAGAKEVNQKLEDLWRLYNRQQRTAQQLLAEGTHLICPNPDREARNADGGDAVQ